jgi:hypothetical protein
MQISLPDGMTPGVRATDLRRYLTDDSVDQVLAWYEQALPEAGFTYQGMTDSGSVFFFTASWRYGMYVTVSQDKTNIIFAAGHE